MEVPARVSVCLQCQKSSPPGSSHCYSCGAALGSEHPTVIATPVECPRCHHSNSAGATSCSSCGASISPENETMLHTATSFDWSKGTRAESNGLNSGISLDVGSVLADRYEILKMLGEGGMGAVYKARDRELDRLVAVKGVRRDLAGHASIMQRFKQELILARKITTRNVVRIFDLGVSDGFRFITMAYIDGQDLSSLLEERKLSPEETVRIFGQVCTAREAALPVWR